MILDIKDKKLYLQYHNRREEIVSFVHKYLGLASCVTVTLEDNLLRLETSQGAILVSTNLAEFVKRVPKAPPG